MPLTRRKRTRREQRSEPDNEKNLIYILSLYHCTAETATTIESELQLVMASHVSRPDQLCCWNSNDNEENKKPALNRLTHTGAKRPSVENNADFAPQTASLKTCTAMRKWIKGQSAMWLITKLQLRVCTDRSRVGPSQSFLECLSTHWRM